MSMTSARPVTWCVAAGLIEESNRISGDKVEPDFHCPAYALVLVQVASCYLYIVRPGAPSSFLLL